MAIMKNIVFAISLCLTACTYSVSESTSTETQKQSVIPNDTCWTPAPKQGPHAPPGCQNWQECVSAPTTRDHCTNYGYQPNTNISWWCCAPADVCWFIPPYPRVAAER